MATHHTPLHWAAAEAVAAHAGISAGDLKVEAPPRPELGDLAVGCFAIAKAKTVPQVLENCICERKCPALREFYDLILKAHAAGSFDLVVSPLLLAELGAVLAREKFRLS